MQYTVSAFIEVVLMVSALSVDTFIASFAYGTGKIRIPLLSVLLISLVCSLALSVSMLLGSIIGPFFQPMITKTVAFCTLAGLGLYYIITPQTPPDADKDRSKSLSLKESVFFAFAMSIDNTAVGISAGLMKSNILFAVILSILFTFAVVKGGSILGKKATQSSDKDNSWIGGLLLILLALLQLS